MRILLVGLIVTLAWVIFPNRSDAKPRVCVRLERQLISLSKIRRSSNPLRVLKYNAAIRRQKSQMKQVNRQIRRAGCSFPANKRSSSCRRLSGGLKKMERNLRKLRAERSRFSGKRPSSNRERRRIKRALAANNCNELRPVIATNRSGIITKRPAKRKTIIEQVFGDGRRNNDRSPRKQKPYYDSEEDFSQSGRGPQFGTFRTLCVRTCDGYFFPISYSTTPDNFDRDVQACTAKCPGTATKLYYHASRGEFSDNMISYPDQTPYSLHQNAFKYRQAATKGCGCDFSKKGQITIAAGNGRANGGLPQIFEPIISTPVYRVDRGEDPETLLNLAGVFTPPVKRPDTATTQNSGNSKRKVRIVGEAFFPSQ